MSDNNQNIEKTADQGGQADVFVRRQRREEEKRKFYYELLPELVGKTFDMPRTYGHAKYEILGGLGAWHSERDATKIYFHFENGKPVITGNRIQPNTLCIAVKRLGGLNGAPKIRFEDVVAQQLISTNQKEKL